MSWQDEALSFRLLRRVQGAQTANLPSDVTGISFISAGQLSSQFSLLQTQPLLESVHESIRFSSPAKDPANHIITWPHSSFLQNLRTESQRHCEIKKIPCPYTFSILSVLTNTDSWIYHTVRTLKCKEYLVTICYGFSPHCLPEAQGLASRLRCYWELAEPLSPRT